MPLALLLQEMSAAFRYGARVLEPWNHLVAVEELLIDRARSAFLVHWWGEGLPLEGFHLRVVIVNIEELRKRYLEVKRAVVLDAQGPNLTEPVFGLAGVAAGLFLTPGVAVGSAVAALRHLSVQGLGLGDALKQIALRVLFLAVSPAAGALVVGLSPALAAGSFVGYLQMGLSNDPNLRGLFDLLGAMAGLLLAATRFIGLLLGPRSAVKNPVLAGLLDLADHLARLFPLALAFVAAIVTRFGPLLLPLAAAVDAFLALIDALVDAIRFVLKDLSDQLKALFKGPNNIVAPLEFVLERIKGPFGRIAETFGQIFTTAKDVLLRWYQEVREEIRNWSIIIGPYLTIALAQDPLRKKIKVISDALALAATYFQTGAPSTASKGATTKLDAWIEKAKAWSAMAQEEAGKFPAVPEFETPAGLAKRLGLVRSAGIPEDVGEYYKLFAGRLPPVNPAVEKYVERARHPASAFAAEEQALARELGAKSPGEALEKAHAQELELRGVIQAVVGRVLPADLRPYMIDLVETFGELDESIDLGKKPGKKAKTAKKETEEIKFPVLDLPDNGLLQPVVQRLVVRYSGGRTEDVQGFVERLRKGLNQPYPAPA